MFIVGRNAGLLDHVNRIRRYPNLQLLKSRLQYFLVFGEKRSCRLLVFYIDKYAYQIVAILVPQMSPRTLNRLRLGGNRAKFRAQFEQRFADKLIGYVLTAIELEGQQNLEPSVRTAHRQPCLPP